MRDVLFNTEIAYGMSVNVILLKFYYTRTRNKTAPKHELCPNDGILFLFTFPGFKEVTESNGMNAVVQT